TLSLGEERPLKILANQSNGAQNDVSALATLDFSTAGSSVAAGQAAGSVKAASLGIASIPVAYKDPSRKAVTTVCQVTVGPATPVQIAVSPASFALTIGSSQALSAVATMTDGTQLSMNGATWSMQSDDETPLKLSSGVAIGEKSGKGKVLVTW